MRCALIIPSWRPEEIFPRRTAISQINYWQPLGTLYVAAALQRAGHAVRFINGAFRSEDEIVAEVRAWRPQFVGLYATTFGWPGAVRTAGLIREALAETFIAAGGPYPIAMAGRCLAEAEALDAVVTGEGEITVVELLARLAAGTGLADCLGVVWRDRGRIVENPPRPFIDNLDSLPFPDRELLGDPDRYLPPPATYRRKPVAVVLTSRGCNRHCIYCFQMDRQRRSGIRYRSVANVLDEIELCLQQGYREIKFIDDTLAADYDRAMRLCRGIQARRLDFTWFASACVNQVDRPLLEAFRQAGCWALLMGAESGVQRNLNTLRKGTTVAQIRQAVAAAKSVGLKVFTPFLIGIPGQTREEVLATIDFACELDPDVANFHALTPFPGTELYDNVEHWGAMSTNLADFTYQGAAFVPHTLRRQEIHELRQLAFRRFYSRPRYLWRRLLALRSASDLRASWQGLVSLFWMWVSRGLFRRSSSTAS